MRLRTSGSIVLGMGALALLGCTPELEGMPPVDIDPVAQPRVVADESLGKVAEMVVGEVRVTFYEPEPGTIVMTELGKAGDEPVLSATRGMRPLDIYEDFSGERAPESLVRAQATVDQLVALAPPRPDRIVTPHDDAATPTRDAEADAPPAARALHNDAWFWGEFCDPLSSEYFKQKRWRNHTANEVDLQLNDVLRASSAVMSLAGTIQVSFKNRHWYTWSGATRVELPKGYYYHYDVSNVLTDYDIKAYISEVGGSDTYDACTDGTRSNIP